MGLNLSDPDFLEKFKAAAAAQRKISTKSPKAAREALYKSGYITKAGKVTANYREKI